MKKSQTATEYLIILAVVIIIGVIVIVALGGIPGIGGKSGQRSESTSLSTASVGVLSHSVRNDSSIVMELRNNEDQTVRIDSVNVSGKTCDIIDLILLPGETTLVNVGSNCDLEVGDVGSAYEYTVTMNYAKDSVTFSKLAGTITGTVGVGVIDVGGDDNSGTTQFSVTLPNGLDVNLCNDGEADYARCTGPASSVPQGTNYFTFSSGGVPIARVHANIDSNKDWSSITAGSDDAKAFFHTDNDALLGISSKTLFVPVGENPDSENYVWVCPDAASFIDITPDCPGGYQGTGSSDEDGYIHVPIENTGVADMKYYGSSGSHSSSGMSSGWGFRY